MSKNAVEVPKDSSPTPASIVTSLNVPSADRHAEAPATVSHTGAGRRVLKNSLAVATIEAVRLALAGCARVVRAVDEVQVEMAVAVVVQPGRAGSDGLREPQLLQGGGAVHAPEVDLGARRGIRQNDGG
jgi:hypothetical protein